MHFIDVGKTERKLGFHAKGNFLLKFMVKMKKMCLSKQFRALYGVYDIHA